MKSIRASILAARSRKVGTVATIGNFDGVHLGHQEIFRRVRETARRAGLQSVIVTLHPHPGKVLGKAADFRLLTPLPEKIRQIRSSGVDHLFVLRFSHSTARLAPRDFVRRYVVKGLGARVLIVGYDFFFGRDREGDSALLEKLAREWGFQFQVVAPIRRHGVLIKSTLIREKINAGEVAEARKLLGRPYVLIGVVRKGRGLGSRIGFPTANLDVGDAVIPAKGIYSVWVEMDRGKYPPERLPAVMSIGTNPTVGGKTLSLEVHIPGWKKPLYGRTLRVELLERIRSEKKFDSVDALKRQIAKDIHSAPHHHLVSYRRPWTWALREAKQDPRAKRAAQTFHRLGRDRKD
ncbi:MAG: bifunctional riboflavin kinase/FAD synthetase [Nitrospirae bacterium]|nr:bifunctional riboflavin kinase/FAD synthetase [Nitrospirota bacterium]